MGQKCGPVLLHHQLLGLMGTDSEHHARAVGPDGSLKQVMSSVTQGMNCMHSLALRCGILHSGEGADPLMWLLSGLMMLVTGLMLTRLAIAPAQPLATVPSMGMMLAASVHSCCCIR